MLYRTFYYVIGLLLCSLGVSFSVFADFGVTAVSGLSYTVAEISGINMGDVSVLFILLMFRGELLLFGKAFQKRYLLAVPASLLYGYFINTTNRIVGILPFERSLLLRVLYLMFGVLCVGVGLFFYMGADGVALPSEGIIQAFSYRFHKPIYKVKTAYDCLLCTCSIVIGISFIGRIVGIGIGTVFSALTVGWVFGWLKKRYTCRFFPDS